MRFRVYLAIFALIIAGNTWAQDTLGIGDIAAPVLELPAPGDSFKPEVPQPAAAITDTPVTGSADSRGLDLAPATGAITLDAKFDNIQQRTTYNALTIVEPADNSTIDIKTSNLLIKANVVPPVRNDLGHVLQIVLGDEVLAENETSYMVDILNRGAHTVQLRIIDENGDVISQSNRITIYIK
jgi:hypothetical protein